MLFPTEMRFLYGLRMLLFSRAREKNKKAQGFFLALFMQNFAFMLFYILCVPDTVIFSGILRHQAVCHYDAFQIIVKFIVLMPAEKNRIRHHNKIMSGIARLSALAVASQDFIQTGKTWKTKLCRP